MLVTRSRRGAEARKRISVSSEGEKEARGGKGSCSNGPVAEVIFSPPPHEKRVRKDLLCALEWSSREYRSAAKSLPEEESSKRGNVTSSSSLSLELSIPPFRREFDY